MERWDAVVIGGGFYGLYLAEFLAVRLPPGAAVRAGRGLMRRASYANQARVHNGYHYPRSVLTASPAAATTRAAASGRSRRARARRALTRARRALTRANAPGSESTPWRGDSPQTVKHADPVPWCRGNPVVHRVRPALHATSRREATWGSVSRNRPPGPSSASILPPCATANSRAIASPSPLPLTRAPDGRSP